MTFLPDTCYACGRSFTAPTVDRDHEDPDRCTDCTKRPSPAVFVAADEEPQPEIEDTANAGA
jgi:hypothetical protein